MATVQLFSQIASLIDRNIVKAAAKKFGTDKGSHKIDTLAHLLALVFCEIADCQSLRDVHVSDGKESDNIGAYHLLPSARSIIVADRGYDDSELRKEWDSRGVTFVVRLHRDIKFDRLEAFEQPVDKEQDILVDEAIRLTGDGTSRHYSRPLRRVVVYRPYDSSRRKKTTEEGETEPPEHTIELVTNNTAWDAETI